MGLTGKEELAEQVLANAREVAEGVIGILTESLKKHDGSKAMALATVYSAMEQADRDSRAEGEPDLLLRIVSTLFVDITVQRLERKYSRTNPEAEGI